MNKTQMDDWLPEDQARKAIGHVLRRIKDSPDLGYHLGLGTESFALLTEAAATLYNEPVEKVREHFRPAEAVNSPR